MSIALSRHCDVSETTTFQLKDRIFAATNQDTYERIFKENLRVV